MRVSEGFNSGGLASVLLRSTRCRAGRPTARVLPQRYALRVIRTATSDCSEIGLRGLSESRLLCTRNLALALPQHGALTKMSDH